MSNDDQSVHSKVRSPNPIIITNPQMTATQGNQNVQTINSRNPIEDPTDSYYLYHGDNPGNTLVSQLLIGQDNCVSLSRAKQLAISIKSKFGFLNGSILKPLPIDYMMYSA
ncbi:hypothetical protein F8388_007327 [Cannabis sativa]|uniref:Retrotransposon Copia-like N-terminal domain-containing protein n=1 Tax=Cannabis sativa TaxID=3483 RepID=A0A7J6FHL1_CANSA|nr:hypothetical protein F8388_007327 [Cannabis sativa]